MKAMKILLGALMVMMALGGMAMATESSAGTTNVNAFVNAYIKVTAPADINAWALSIGDAESNVITATPSVDSNTAWSLSVKSAVGIPPGYDYHGQFYSAKARAAGLGAPGPDGLVGFMNNRLIIDHDGIDDALTNLGFVIGTGSVGTTPVPVDLEQQVVLNDPAEDDYLIVLEFDATTT